MVGNRYRIMRYKDKKGLIRLDFQGLAFGYSGNPVLLEEHPRTLLIKELPGKHWAGMGMTRYGSPRLMVVLRVPGTVHDLRKEHFLYYQAEHVVGAMDKEYTRQDRAQVYREARWCIEDHEQMPEAAFLEKVGKASSHDVATLRDMGRIP